MVLLSDNYINASLTSYANEPSDIKEPNFFLTTSQCQVRFIIVHWFSMSSKFYNRRRFIIVGYTVFPCQVSFVIVHCLSFEIFSD